MSSSSGLAAAKRRRGNVPGQQGQPQQGQPQQVPTLSVPQSIYVLSNRITNLEAQLQSSVTYLENQLTQVSTNNTVINENKSNNSNEIISENTNVVNDGEFINKADFNDVMSSVGSDMNDLGQKMNTLNEFVLSVQNSYLTLNKILLELQSKASLLEDVTNDNEKKNTSDMMSLEIKEKNDLADFKKIEEDAQSNNVDMSDMANDTNVEKTFEDSDEENESNTQEVVSADITSRLKQLSIKSSKNENDAVVEA